MPLLEEFLLHVGFGLSSMSSLELSSLILDQFAVCHPELCDIVQWDALLDHCKMGKQY